MFTYISALVILFIVLKAHILGVNGLYYLIPGYDIMMHILGGIGIALFVVALLRTFKQDSFFNIKFIVLSVFIIGIVWELFEIYFQITGHPLWSNLYFKDTIKDLINDTIGGLFVAYIVTKKYKFSYKTSQKVSEDSINTIE